MQNVSAASVSRLLFVPLLGACMVAYAENRETRALTGFDAVSVGGGVDLFVRQGADFRVEVVSDDDLAEIVTEVRDGTLEIRRERTLSRFFDWGDQGAVHVTLPALTALTASGGSDVRTEGTFSGDELALVASGGSDVELDVAVDTLTATASGGSDALLTGTARVAQLHSSGGSDLNASRFTVAQASVESSGGSDVSIAVSESLVANASGGSDITYSGEPRTVNVNASGGADVRRR
jgi:hypothetical protein